MSTLARVKTKFDIHFSEMRDFLSFSQRSHTNHLKNIQHEHYYYFVSQGYPHTNQCMGITCPRYIFTSKSLNDISETPYTFAKDGLYPLIEFFIKFPRPAGIGSVIIINRDLDFIVPELWKSHTLYYHFETIEPEVPKTIENINIIVSTASSDLNEFELEGDLKAIKEAYPEAKVIKVFCHNNLNPYEPIIMDRKDPSLRSQKILFEHFDIDENMCSWSEMCRQKDLRQSVYHVCGHPLFNHGFSYVDHYMLAKGATPFNKHKKREYENEFRINESLHHDLVVTEKRAEKNDIWERINLYLKNIIIDHGIFRSELYYFIEDIAKDYGVIKTK